MVRLRNLYRITQPSSDRAHFPPSILTLQFMLQDYNACPPNLLSYYYASACASHFTYLFFQIIAAAVAAAVLLFFKC